MQKKVIEKGYTVEVTSWENDGDNYKTKSQTYQTKEEALAVRDMCNTLFASSNNGEGGIGNLMDDESDKAYPIIVNFLVRNPELLKINNIKTPYDYEEEIKKAFPEATDSEDWVDFIHEYIEEVDSSIQDDWIDFIGDYNYQLMGSSEYYYSRISENVDIFYSPNDVYLQKIE